MNIIKRGICNIVRNPVRLALAVVLLGVSLLFVVAMLGLNESAQARLNELNDQVGTSITILPPEGALSQQQFDLIVHSPGVINYAGESIADCHSTDPHFQLISPFPPSRGINQGGKPVPGNQNGTPVSKGNQGHQNGNANGQNNNRAPAGHTICYGFTPGAPAIVRLKGSVPGGDALTIVEGRMFTASDAGADVAVIGANLAQHNHLHPGTTIALNGKTLTVIGIYTTGSPWNAFVILPVQTVLRYLGGSVYGLTVYTSNHTRIPEMLAMLHRELGDGFQFSTMQGQFDASIQSLDAIQQTSLLTLLAALAAAILVIVFTVFLLVRERRREIGILRAVGASIWQVVAQFAIEILSSSLIAALLAALLLLPVGPLLAGATVIAPPINHGASVGNSAALLAAAQPLTITLTMHSVLALLLASLLLAMVASSIPAWYVSRLRPAHALRTK